MNNIKYILIFLGLAVLFASVQCSIVAEERYLIGIEPQQERALEIEDRQTKHRSGIIKVLEAVTIVMQSILKFIDGQVKMDAIVGSIQEAFRAAEELVNIKAIIHEFPIIGPTVATIVSPILDLLAMLIQNTPVFGSVLSQLIIGPEYPVTLPPPPPTQATTKKSGWGWA